MKTKTYDVLGMHCIGCSMGIQKLLKKTKGIDDVQVRLSESKIDVTYDEQIVNDTLVIETVGRLGYKAVATQS